MLVDKQNELMSDLLFTVHQHGGNDVTWRPPILGAHKNLYLLKHAGHAYSNFGHKKRLGTLMDCWTL